MDVPGPHLGPLEPVAGPFDIPRAQVDLAVLAHSPGQVRAFDREIVRVKVRSWPEKLTVRSFP